METAVQPGIAVPPLPPFAPARPGFESPRAQKFKKVLSLAWCLGMWIVHEGPKYSPGTTLS